MKAYYHAISEERVDNIIRLGFKSRKKMNFW